MDSRRALTPLLRPRLETVMPDPLSPDLLQKMHAYWRAANYLSVGQIYLQDNPLLETPLKLEHTIRRIPRLSGEVERATARYWTTMERHKLYISEHGEDMPEVRDWRWSL